MVKLHRCEDASIAYWDDGAGEPVLLVHASLGADWFAPLASLLPGHRVLRPHRAGYGRSLDLSPDGRELSLADHAGHLAQLLHAQHITRAHVVGHSSGASIALHLAAQHPHLVHSLVLLEPALPTAPDEPKSEAMGNAIAAARNHDWEQAFDSFLASVMSPGYRDLITRTLGAQSLAESVHSSRYFFERELTALIGWDDTAAGLDTLTQPVLLVDGGDGELLHSPYRARNRALAQRLPHATQITLPGVSHAMPLENPHLLARTILDFTHLHPRNDVLRQETSQPD